MTAEEQAEATAQPRGPYGTIAASLFGPVRVGMTQDEVRGRFGEPDRVTEVNFGTGRAPQTNWIWKAQGGEVTLKFDNATGQLAGYATTSPSFESAPGALSVGDPLDRLVESYGEQLARSPANPKGLVLSEGAPGTEPALTFAFSRRRIVEISGGALVQPAGE